MSQKIILGEGCSGRLPFLSRQMAVRRLLFVVGSSHKLLARKINFSAEEVKVQFLVVPEGILTKEVVDVLLAQVLHGPDLVVAMGGGRILDAAKLLLYHLPFNRPFFLAIPTTAGSGSEATHFAVLYDGLNKTSVQHQKLLPDQVLLDPLLLEKLPKKQRAISAIDALAQAVESLWSIHADAISKVHAAQALELIWKGFRDYTQDNDASLNKQFMWASFLAGKAIAITRTTGCHALSYYLTAKHDVPHGQAVGFFLPLFFMYNAHAMPEIICRTIGFRSPKEGLEKTRQLMNDSGLATDFKTAGIEVDISQLLDSVNEERFKNNPVPFDRGRLKELIQQYLC